MKSIQTVYFPVTPFNSSQAAAYVAGAMLYPELDVVEPIRRIRTPWLRANGTQLMAGPKGKEEGVTKVYDCFTFSVPESVHSGEEYEYYVFQNRTLTKCEKKPEVF